MNQRDINETDQIALEAYRARACAEADAAFDDQALETQRHKILAKLAHLGHPARVIRFPKAPLGDINTGAINRRWVSVAAAAGLIIGVLGGQFVHLVPQQARPAAIAPSNAPSLPAQPQFLQISAPIDDGLLDEVELAMNTRGAAELHALDELTPR